MESESEQFLRGENILWPKECQKLVLTSDVPQILTNRRFLEKREDFERETGKNGRETFSIEGVQVSDRAIAWDLRDANQLAILRGVSPGQANFAISFKVAGRSWWRPAFAGISYKEYKEFSSRLSEILPRFRRRVRDGVFRTETIYGGGAAGWIFLTGFIFALLYGLETSRLTPIIGFAWNSWWFIIGLEGSVVGFVWLLFITKLFWRGDRVAQISLYVLLLHGIVWGVGIVVYTSNYFPQACLWALGILVVWCVHDGISFTLQRYHLNRVENITIISNIVLILIFVGFGFWFMFLITSEFFGLGLASFEVDDLIFLTFVIGFPSFIALLGYFGKKQEDRRFAEIYLRN